MAPLHPLSVATNSITRLLKEESSYRTELATQQQRVEQLQANNDGGGGEGNDEEDGGNSEFRLRQEVSLYYLSIYHFRLSNSSIVLGCCAICCFAGRLWEGALSLFVVVVLCCANHASRSGGEKTETSG